MAGTTTASPEAPQRDPVKVAIRLRAVESHAAQDHFTTSDPPAGWDIAKYPRVARILRNRRFQFALILPNQIIFWLVITLGLAGTVIPGLNFGTAITWYLWFCLVFVMMVAVGRAWCVMCPFGGFAEWVQRRTFWNRTQKSLGLGLKVPEPIARYGFLWSIATFVGLTYVEEYFNIALPGVPSATSWMVLGIVTSALVFFLVFERRSFCRYFCPLSALIGTVGAAGSVAGFRTRDRQVCLSCKTKDCMRGGTSGYSCPWYTWPGSADSNLACGLCSECYKGCPEGNIGLFLQRPLTSVIAPLRRRADIAWGIVILWGLVLFQQVNAFAPYAAVDSWLNSHMHYPGYPNPVDYFGVIAVVALAVAGVAWVAANKLVSPARVPATAGRGFLERSSKFRAFFLPMTYGLIPVVGADFFARQLPKLFKHVARLIPAIGNPFGLGSTHSPLYNVRLLTNPQIVGVQIGVIAIGTLAAAWTSWKIANRDLGPISTHPRVARLVAVGLAVACGLAAGTMYLFMNAAS